MIGTGQDDKEGPQGRYEDNRTGSRHEINLEIEGVQDKKKRSAL